MTKIVNKKIIWDKILLGIAIMCVVFPFLYGWTKWYIMLTCSSILIYSGYKIWDNIKLDLSISITENKSFWLLSLAIISIWALFSGIGKFSYQTGDFVVRNPMFRDLCQYTWPVYYDLHEVPEFAEDIIGNTSTAAYVYYFTWWLPVAGLKKLFSCSEAVSNVLLYLWTVLELFLIFYCLVLYLKKYSYWILSTFILFGGLDFVMWTIRYMKIADSVHIERWADFLQYSSNTTQLYWVFNQSIPLWLIIALFLLLKESRNVVAICSLSFAYSPLATIGIIPYAIVSVLNSGDKKDNIWKKVGKAISIENIFVPLIILIIFGTFYLQNSNSLGNKGFIFIMYPQFKTVTLYISFIIVEFIAYFIAMGRPAMKYRFYWITLIELILLPLYRMGMYNDFCMRASIPSIMILMTIMLNYCLDKQLNNISIKRRKLVIVFMLIGYLTSATEIQRNVKETLNNSQDTYLQETFYSLADLKPDMKNQVELNLNQYMALNYKDSFFYKYIAVR